MGLLYFFLGIAVIMDTFMTSIETIINKKKKQYEMRDDVPDSLFLKVWNETVANLTLMSLGVAAPEILLSIIETVGHELKPGYIGPGTIVGSAAVNILVVAFCMLSLSKGDIRKIKNFRVFLVTGFFHVFSFTWLYIIVGVITPNVIDIWEALVTLLLFPVLVFVAFATSKKCWKKDISTRLRGDESRKEFVEAAIRDAGGSIISMEGVRQYYKELRKYSGLTAHDAATVAAAKLAQTEDQSPIWYRIGGTRILSSGRPVKKKLKKRLEQVYTAIGEYPVVPSTPELQENAIVEFEASTLAIKEATLLFPVYITRYGNMDHTIKARVMSVDGMAVHGEDYVPVNEIVTFSPGQSSAEIKVKLIDERKYEPTEEFFLRLSIPFQQTKVKLGKVYIMEIKIVPNDSPGWIEFEKRGTVVKETSKVVEAIVVRNGGRDGRLSVHWVTVDKTARAGEDYVFGNGEIVFNDGEIRKSIYIPLINTMSSEKDVCFEILLHSPTDGVMLGVVRTMKIIVTDDEDDIFDIVEQIAFKTNLSAAVFDSWCQQIKNAMQPNGGEIETASNLDYFLHFFFFFWKLKKAAKVQAKLVQIKFYLQDSASLFSRYPTITPSEVLFSLIPPPTFFGGWVSFFTSLLLIALLAALVGDMASIFGCAIGLHDTLTAITVVAIGTSLTDAFACRFALINSHFADNAIGNINGTAAITVYIGLGLPWLMASIYQETQGQKAEVSSEGLGMTVLAYSIASSFTLCLLVIRRKTKFFGRAEIGGPSIGRYVSAALLVTTWLLFITMSYLDVQTYVI